MGFIFSRKRLNKILPRSELKELEDIDELETGDKILASVGTYSGRFTNNDWRWIKGDVKKIIPSRRIIPMSNGREEDYNIVEVSSFKNRFSLPFITIDLDQKKGHAYGRILRFN